MASLLTCAFAAACHLSLQAFDRDSSIAQVTVPIGSMSIGHSAFAATTEIVDSASGCTWCADVSTPHMDNNNLECATWPWMREHRCNKDPNWTLLKVCQFSCYQNGAGYPGDNCCDTVRS